MFERIKSVGRKCVDAFAYIGEALPPHPGEYRERFMCEGCGEKFKLPEICHNHEIDCWDKPGSKKEVRE